MAIEPFIVTRWTLAVRVRSGVNAKTFVSAALILAASVLLMYLPVHFTEETFIGSSTLPCYTTTILVPSGTWATYTMSLCSCTLVQSQSYESRYMPTLTCPVTVYTSTHVVGSTLAQDIPWLPVLFLILMAACLAGVVYAMTKRDMRSKATNLVWPSGSRMTCFVL
jgi:hypothetical protein